MHRCLVRVLSESPLARWLRAWLCLCLAGAACPAAWATAYTFPGSLPGNCTSTALGVYACTAWTMGTSDTVTITGTAVIGVVGDLNIKGSQLNASGATANLTMTVTGTLYASAGGRLNGNVTAGSVGSTGAVYYGGSLTTGIGNISIDAGSTVVGALTSTTGAIILSAGTASSYTTVGSITTGGAAYVYSYNRVLGATTAGLVSAGSYPWFGDKVVATTGYVSFADHATVYGDIAALTYVYTGTYSTINGSITSTTLQVDTVGHTTVTGNITANGTYVNLGLWGNVGGNILAKWYVDVGTYGVIGGDVTSLTSYVNGDSVNIGGNITAGGTFVDIHSNGTVGGNIQAATYVNIVNNNDITGTVTALGGPAYIYSGNTFGRDVTSTSLFSALDNNIFAGSVTSQLSYVYIGLSDQVAGNVTAATTVQTGSFTQVGACARSTGSQAMIFGSPSLVQGACCGVTGATCGKACILSYPKPADCKTLHHLAIQHASGTGLTCTPSTVTVVACADSTCSTLYTQGVTGTLTATGTGLSISYPGTSTFTIPAGASSTTVSFQQLNAGSMTLGALAASPLATSATTCNFGSPSCTFTSADSGFLMSASPATAGSSQTLSVAAVKKLATSTTCAPGFASVVQSLKLTCGYSNPSTGTLPVTAGGVALNSGGNAASACDGVGQTLSLSFNALGVATTTLQYPDVGQVTLGATLLGSGALASLVMSGSASFISAPASFAVSQLSTSPIKAGSPFSVKVSALNSLGVVTPNFGRESSPEGVSLSWTRRQPTGTGVAAGSFSGSGVSAALKTFASGLATVSDLVWTEVGTGDITATLASGSYLGSGLSSTGISGLGGAIGRFVPHHFDVGITNACGLFTYSGQPFSVVLTARNAASATTLNYDGSGLLSPSLALPITLTAVSNGGLGSFDAGTDVVALSKFTQGVATAATPVFRFTNKLTAPATITIRGTDSDGISSSGWTEGSVPLRSGRLRLTNAFGSEKSPLTMVAQAQHWSGKVWVLNSLDSCSLVPLTAVALGNYLGAQGSNASGWTTSIVPDAGGKALSIGNGTATLTLAAPTATNGKAPVGTVDVGLNLGSGTADASCLATPRPSTTGANLSWLRAQFGSSNGCLGVVDYLRDPSARATFGVYAPEVKRLIHATEVP